MQLLQLRQRGVIMGLKPWTFDISWILSSISLLLLLFLSLLLLLVCFCRVSSSYDVLHVWLFILLLGHLLPLIIVAIIKYIFTFSLRFFWVYLLWLRLQTYLIHHIQLHQRLCKLMKLQCVRMENMQHIIKILLVYKFHLKFIYLSINTVFSE